MTSFQAITDKRAALATLRGPESRTDYFLELAPPWKSSRVDAFEIELGVQLSPDFREFVTSVGVGRAPGGRNGLKTPDASQRQGEELCLASLGCGSWVLMALTGEPGTTRVVSEGEPAIFATFSAWYEDYLDDAIRGYAGQALASATASTPRSPLPHQDLLISVRGIFGRPGDSDDGLAAHVLMPLYMGSQREARRRIEVLVLEGRSVPEWLKERVG